METKAQKIPDWALWFACVLPLLGFWTYGLFDLDEGFYAAVVSDMIHRHDWITPTLNGVPWFEKPILAYWLAIPSVQIFGEVIGPRLPSVCCTIATIIVLYRFVKAHFDVLTARLAAVVCATNLLVVGIGRMMMTDAPLVLCLALVFTTFWDSLSGKPQMRTWSAFFLGLAVLAKGPVAAILFIGVVALTYWRLPDLRRNFRGYWLLGTVVCLATLSTWYVPCYLANGQGFVQKFLIEQNIGRFAGGDKAHAVPVWSHPIYYPLVLVASFLPWIVFCFRDTVKGAWNRKAQIIEPVMEFVWLWALVPLAFFTISGTKLPHYILPTVAPLSVIIAANLLKRNPGRNWERMGLAWSACVMVLAQYIFYTDWDARMRDSYIGAKSADAPLFVYKLGGSGDTSMSLTLRDTSHPSIYFYHPGKTVMTDDPSLWVAEPNSFILTSRDIAATDPALQTASLGNQGFDVTVEPIAGLKRYVLLKRLKR